MEKRYFEGVQDCREFQGEVFGICNLFRDLSDKLFTSEIIELHEKQGTENQNFGSSKQDLTELGICFLRHKEVTGASMESSENGKPKDESKKTVKPILEGLGIVYAHRNENIVNFGPGTEGEKELNKHIEDIEVSCVPGIKRKSDSAGRMNNAENAASSKTRKKSQYSALAQLMGMEEVEFSKWLLSATPEEREKLIWDYKRRKDKLPYG